MSGQLSQIIKEIKEKNREKGEKYTKTVIISSILWGVLIGVIMSPIFPTSTPNNPYIIWFVNTYFLSIVFMLFGICCMFLVSTGEVTKPYIRNRYDNLKTFLNIILNSPDKRATLQAIKLFNDIRKKNAVENYLDNAEVFDSMYKRLGRNEADIAELKNKINRYNQESEDWREKERMYLNQNSRINKQLWAEKWENKKLRKENNELKMKQNENDQIVGDKTKTQLNTDLSKSLKKSDKIEFLDE